MFLGSVETTLLSATIHWLTTFELTLVDSMNQIACLMFNHGICCHCVDLCKPGNVPTRFYFWSFFYSFPLLISIKVGRSLEAIQEQAACGKHRDTTVGQQAITELF